ncbi:AAA family ATPase, partial [Erysipelothrix rhusiopathiae]|nr:AAA family ATPase [Erysipelothrix rhusiopathiae]
YSQIIIEDFETPKIISDIDVIKLNIHNYIFNKNINKIAFFINNSLSLKRELTRLKEKLDKAMELNAEKYEKGINETLKKVGLDKDISLVVNKRGSSMTYQVNMSNNNDIKTLSNGQQHRLALALFLYSLKEKEYKDKTIVIDDPVVTLDALGYHQVKRYLVTDLISTFNKNGDVRLLILTHDFNYLTVQVHDILDNDKKYLKDITGIFKINHDGLSEFDIELLFKDDISLFKLILDKIDSIESLSLLPNINLKIFRHFIDLKQRIQGVPQVTGINIKTLLIDDDAKKKCRDYQSNNISKFKGKDTSEIDILEVYKDLVSLQEVLKVLGFPEVIENSRLEYIKSILDNGISKDFLDPVFDIISAINNFLLRNTDSDIRNYIMHPRVSFTSNLISMALDEEFGIID